MWFYKKIYATAGGIFLIFLALVASVLNSLKLPDVDPLTCINLRLSHSPASLDPMNAVDLVSGDIMAKIYSGLVKLNADLDVVPDIAEFFEIQDEGRKFFFRLREDAKFSDGKSIFSQDVLRSWKRIVSSDKISPRSWVFQSILGIDEYMQGITPDIKGIQILNSRDLRIELSRPFATFINLLTMPAAFIVPSEQEIGTVFTGPYKIKEYRPDNFLVLESNTYYPGMNRHVGILYKILPEDLSSMALFTQGKLDIFKVPRSQIPFFNDDQKSSWIEIEELNTYYLGFDHRKPDLDQPFRQAIFAMLDRQEMCDIILQGMGKVCETVVPGILLKNLEPDAKPFGLSNWKNSQASVSEYLNSSQYKGREITLLLSATAENRLIGLYLQEKLKQHQIPCKIRMLDWSAYKTAIHEGEGDIFYLSWWADYADAENFLYPVFHSKNHGSGGNRTYCTSLELDHMLDKLHTVHGQHRQFLLKEIFGYLDDFMPWVPLWHKTAFYAESGRLESYVPSPIYTMEKGDDWIV